MTPSEIAWMLRTGNYTKKRAVGRDPERFPASAGPWFDVRFETESAARRFASNVRKVLGYRASIDETNPRNVVTNAARWEISELMVRTNTPRGSSPLSTRPHS